MDSRTLGHHNHHHHIHQEGYDNNNKSMADNSTSSYIVWKNFFLSAGIPDAVGQEYAATFSQHRIRIDMLKEITKEILLDMGIKAMGDIIAILRHAKNLYTQDELKIGTKTTASAVIVSTPAINATNTFINPLPNNSLNHLAQRTPITTSRSGPSISSLVGNKIQSRVSSASGALIASSNNNPKTSQSNGSSTSSGNNNNKRTSSSISNSLAKRLRPANTPEITSKKNITEKTLTVYYPSSAAVAKAQQRIMTNTSTTTRPASIKSRLGVSPVDSSRSGGTNRNYIKYEDHNNRLKSTVFNRLGKGAR